MINVLSSYVLLLEYLRVVDSFPFGVHLHTKPFRVTIVLSYQACRPTVRTTDSTEYAIIYHTYTED